MKQKIPDKDLGTCKSVPFFCLRFWLNVNTFIYFVYVFIKKVVKFLTKDLKVCYYYIVSSNRHFNF